MWFYALQNPTRQQYVHVHVSVMKKIIPTVSTLNPFMGSGSTSTSSTFMSSRYQMPWHYHFCMLHMPHSTLGPPLFFPIRQILESPEKDWATPLCSTDVSGVRAHLLALQHCQSESTFWLLNVISGSIRYKMLNAPDNVSYAIVN